MVGSQFNSGSMPAAVHRPGVTSLSVACPDLFQSPHASTVAIVDTAQASRPASRFARLDVFSNLMEHKTMFLCSQTQGAVNWDSVKCFGTELDLETGMDHGLFVRKHVPVLLPAETRLLRHSHPFFWIHGVLAKE